jgi:UDP-N-acetylmuramoyl-tripeptide--D-alanyl-D-alanine ligase
MARTAAVRSAPVQSALRRVRRIDTDAVLHRVIAAVLAGQLRLFLRRNPGVIVVAVTGSVGKTTTKLAVASVLGQRMRVRAHPGNYNTDIGVPMTAFDLESPEDMRNPRRWMSLIVEGQRRAMAPAPYDVLVVELGASRVGGISRFSYLKPDIGIVTAIRPNHLSGFGSIENVAREKMALAAFSRRALLNADDERVMSGAASLRPARCSTFGIEHGDYQMIPGRLAWPTGYAGSVVLCDDARFAVQSRFVARYTLPALAAAAAVGDLLGLAPEEIRAGLEAARPVAGRMNVLRGLRESVIIDDSYNASAHSVLAALEALRAAPGTAKIAVLGDINGMASTLSDNHTMVGGRCADLDHLVTIGGLARELLVPAAIAAGLPMDRIHSFSNPYEAGWYTRQILAPGTVVLVKGSQSGVLAEEATALLLADPRDRTLLVRQSAWWQTVKRQTYGRLAEGCPPDASPVGARTTP